MTDREGYQTETGQSEHRDTEKRSRVLAAQRQRLYGCDGRMMREKARRGRWMVKVGIIKYRLVCLTQYARMAVLETGDSLRRW